MKKTQAVKISKIKKTQKQYNNLLNNQNKNQYKLKKKFYNIYHNH